MVEPLTELPPACMMRGCPEDAVVYEGDDGYCFDHFERMVDRWQAIEMNPAMRDLLPAVDGR